MIDGLRAIHLAEVGTKTRPVLLLTREIALGCLPWVSVAPITSRVHGIAVEVAVGRDNGLDHDSVVNLDHVQTIQTRALGRSVGFLLPAQEEALLGALRAAYDLP